MRIPVSVAENICIEHDQDLVVLVGCDGLQVHVATFGTRPAAKDVAARWGEAFANVALGGAELTKVHEDFRATPEATYKAALDAARRALEEISSRAVGCVQTGEEPLVALSEYQGVQEVAREALKKLK